MTKPPSNFAISQLKKYGWTEGDGLGKKKDGITDPVKASMKFSRRGVGAAYLTARKDESFWSDVYQEANSRVGVKLAPSRSGLPKVVSIETTHDDTPVEEGWSGKSPPETKRGEVFPRGISFQRQGILKHGEETRLSRKAEKRQKQKNEKCAEAAESSGYENAGPSKYKANRLSNSGFYHQPIHALSDTCLLELGKGRTGHPAARFGMRCGGKLTRASEFL